MTTETTTIIATTKREWELLDATSDHSKDLKRVNIPAGTHELERIINPCRHEGNWLVLKGTLIGMGEKAWMQWINGVLANRPGHPSFGKPIDWGLFEIQLEENGVLIPPPRGH